MMLASREWNDAQRQVVESFQQARGGVGDGSVYLPVVLLAILFAATAYILVKRKRR